MKRVQFGDTNNTSLYNWCHIEAFLKWAFVFVGLWLRYHGCTATQLFRRVLINSSYCHIDHFQNSTTKYGGKTLSPGHPRPQQRYFWFPKVIAGDIWVCTCVLLRLFENRAKCNSFHSCAVEWNKNNLQPLHLKTYYFSATDTFCSVKVAMLPTFNSRRHMLQWIMGNAARQNPLGSRL